MKLGGHSSRLNTLRNIFKLGELKSRHHTVWLSNTCFFFPQQRIVGLIMLITLAQISCFNKFNSAHLFHKSNCFKGKANGRIIINHSLGNRSSGFFCMGSFFYMGLTVFMCATIFFWSIWRYGLLPEKSYATVAAPPAPVQVLSQRPLVPSVTTVTSVILMIGW